jgi:hypothetical protein
MNKIDLKVQGNIISKISFLKEDYISITDIARIKNALEPKDVVKNWMRSRSTIEFLGIWESLNNENFKGVEFDSLLFDAGSNSFTLSPSKWIQTTNAIGIISKQGKSGGTFAHKDIASWVNSGFKLYLIKEYQRLKEEESSRLNLEWNFQRTLSKINYHIHTDAIKEYLIPKTVTKQQISYIYATEADVLNIALFGITSKEWQQNNPNLKGNIRDYATIEQLVVLSNLESLNSVLIQQDLNQEIRLIQLNKIAINQIQALVNHKKSLEKLI